MKKFMQFFGILALVSVFAASAAASPEAFFANDEEPLPEDGEVWTVSGTGESALRLEDAWALTAAGAVPLGTPEEENPNRWTGGGGLVSEGGTISVDTRRIAVGLQYYYSDGRDDSMEEAFLENFVGTGYALGTLDSEGNFVPSGLETEEKRLTLRPTEDGGVEAYATDTEELLYSMKGTGKNRWLAVRPLGGRREAQTWFQKKRYTGDFAYADLGNGKLTVVNVMELERYVLGVLAGEMSSGFPKEALKAQAVCARTYGVYNLQSGVYRAACGFDLTADTWCQVYAGYTDAADLQSAVAETRGEYLTYQGALAQALYFAADGGETLDSEAVFPNAIAYLRGVEDPYEGDAWTGGAHGHRVGMSQWGAYAMARYHDKTYKDILGFYYTGVGLSRSN